MSDQQPGAQIDILGQVSSVRNFHEVIPFLYRGGQPGAQGIAELARAGIKTVVCFRWGAKVIAAEKAAVEAAGMRFISIPMYYWRLPGLDVTEQFLDLVDDETTWPLFAHCLHGADRTGLIMAMFRMTRQHWHVDTAYGEMKRLGFHRFRIRHFKWNLYQFSRALRSHHKKHRHQLMREEPIHHAQLGKTRSAVLVYNPKSGTSAKVRQEMDTITSFLEDKLGYSVTLISWHCPGGGPTLDDEILNKPDLIVAAGGDGTIGSVLESLSKLDVKIPVAIIPIGTGNLLARSLGIYPTRTEQTLLEDAIDLYVARKPTHEVIDYALNVLAHGVAVPVDMATANHKWMAIGAGIGPLARAIARPCSDEKKAWGMLAYAGSLFKLMFRSHRTFLIKIDEEEPFEAEAMGVFVSNLPNLGIGTPEKASQLRDGLLDVFILDCDGPISFFRLWLRFFFWILGYHRLPPYLSRRVKRVRVTALEHSGKPTIVKPKLSVDGDSGGQGPLDVEVVPDAALIYIPMWVANPKAVKQTALSP